MVHIPVMMIPLAAIGALLALFMPRWRAALVPITAVFATVGLVGVQIAIMTGQGLQNLNNDKTALIERHSQLAEQARPLVFVFFVLAVAAAGIQWLQGRRAKDTASETSTGRATPPLLVKAFLPILAFSVLMGAVSTVWIIRTGHSGAESVWK